MEGSETQSAHYSFFDFASSSNDPTETNETFIASITIESTTSSNIPSEQEKNIVENDAESMHLDLMETELQQ